MSSIPVMGCKAQRFCLLAKAVACEFLLNVLYCVFVKKRDKDLGLILRRSGVPLLFFKFYGGFRIKSKFSILNQTQGSRLNRGSFVI